MVKLPIFKDLRFQMNEETRGTGSWRTLEYEKEVIYTLHMDLDQYHSMNLLRSEDTFKTLVSFSSPAMGRKKFGKENFPANHKWNNLNYQNGI